MPVLQMQQTDRLHRKALTNFVAVFAFTVVALLLFRQFPSLDVFVSRMAFTFKPCAPDSTLAVCGGFLLQSSSLLNLLREISLQIPNILGFGIFFYLVYQIFLNRNTTAKEIGKLSLVIWTVMLSTVLLINLILKELWGRPRPYQVEEFGGDHPFVLPGTISSYCESNCSFVSGEASSAAWLIAFLIFLPNRWRLPVGVFLSIYLVFFSGLRIAFGRHFLSDVTMSVLFTFCIIAFLNMLFSTVYFRQLFEKFARWSNQVAFDLKVS
jgi:lipid A 4'-phosphatase